MIKMENVFSIDKWENVQDSLAETTGMAILMVDYKGRPITKHSSCCEFCQKVREDEILRQYCEKCDSRGGAEAVRENKPYIYKCCFGLVDVAIPIVFKEVYLGAVMVGQVKTTTSELEEIVTLPVNKTVMNRLEDVKKEYDRIRVLDFDKINTVSYMLYDICNYIVEREALGIKTGRIIDESVLEPKREASFKENKIVTKAKKYIRENLERNVMLSDTAKHCHVSTSYLSRLFVQETGESFSVYLCRVRIDKAKEWLEEDEWSVSDIGYRLGFTETGYFIKIFKKNVGMTPRMYRKYRRKTIKKD